jgi:hypothetical protein
LVAPAGGVHVAQVAPHEVMDSGRHWLPQRTKPGLHSKSQAGAPPGEALRHTDTAFAGAWQGVHAFPQVATSKFETQSVPHWWKPAAQTKPQSLPSQVGVAFGGVMQASQRCPQVALSKFDTHWFPQRWKPGWQVKSQAPFTQAGTAFAPAAAVHDRQREPQAVTVLFGTQLPPHSVVFCGQTHRVRL